MRSKRNGNVTIASNLVVRNGKVVAIEAAVSACSPKDQFSKKTGRRIAESRLFDQDSRWYREYPLRQNRDYSAGELNDILTLMVLTSIEMPDWFDPDVWTYEIGYF